MVSDDYISLFAALRGLPDYVPRYILGRPENPHIRDLQGPIRQQDVLSRNWCRFYCEEVERLIEKEDMMVVCGCCLL